MADSVELRVFPSDKYEALAMAYLNAQELSAYTPEQIVQEYEAALSKVKAEFKRLHGLSGNTQKVSY